MGVVLPIGHQKAVPRATGRPVYLGRLAPGSRRGIRVALETLARYLSNGSADALVFGWACIRYDQASPVRQYLAKTYSPKTTNLAISALRGVLKGCWRFGADG
jgi:integrase/recombinase XerD